MSKHSNVAKRVIILTFLLVLCLMVSTVLSGCGKEPVSTETAGGSKSTEKPAETSNSGNGSGDKETITIALQRDGTITDYKDNWLTNKLEDEMNINIEIYELPVESDEVSTKVSLMISGGDDLPDVFCVEGMSSETILDYGSKGTFIPLNSYINDPNVAVNFNAIPEEDKKLALEAMTSADGNIYSLPRFNPETWDLTPNRLYMNIKWLEKLGLEIPTTTDEYYEALKAFADKDPNGNGIKDELPVYGYANGGYGENITVTLMNSFVFYNEELGLSDDGNTVIAPYTTDGWKKGLEFMNKLSSEGLLSPSVFTDDSTQFKATLNNDSANLIGSVSAGSKSLWTDPNKNVNFSELDMIKPLKGPDGIAYSPYTPYAPDMTWFITSASKNPELAFKLGDLFFRRDISMDVRYGEEGVDWSSKEEDLVKYSNPYVSMGIYDKVSLVYFTNIYAENNNKFWHNINPRYASVTDGNTWANGTSEYDPNLKSEQLYVSNYKYNYAAHPEHVLPALKYTREETEKIMEPATNIPVFVKQATAEFITGARNLSDWDQYLTELKNMGLDQWLENSQAAYDRMK